MNKKTNTAPIVVLPTDTLYGLCTSAFSPRAVEKIYDMKGRDDNKPFIILISHLEDMRQFGVSSKLITMNKKLLDTIWPGKVSIIFPLKHTMLKKYQYLHRGTGKLAFRIPDKKSVIQFIHTRGPLVAPSANPQSKKPAETLSEAKKYFGKNVDYYIAGGRLTSAPSTILEIGLDGNITIVRQGAVNVSEIIR